MMDVDGLKAINDYHACLYSIVNVIKKLPLHYHDVITTKVGIQRNNSNAWIPAFAGMTTFFFVYYRLTLRSLYLNK